MSGNPLILDDLGTVLRRRKAHFAIPVFVILLLSGALAYLLPAIYVSTATIVIEKEEIPESLVASTVTAYAAERVQKIRLRVMTADKLWPIVEKLNVYADKRAQENQDDIIAQMRENISIDMVASETVDSRKGKTSSPTIAFTVSYANEVPELAQAVTAELSELFLSEDHRNRTENAQQTSSFLNDEAQRLQRQISDIEAKISAFKVRNAGSLPQALDVTSKLLETSQRELELVDAQLSPLESRHALLINQLSGFGLSAQLAEARAELATAREKYSEIHPDVVRLKRTVNTLEAKVQTGDSAVHAAASTDPMYLELQLESQNVLGKIGELRAQRAVLGQRIAEYRSRLAKFPEVEREYAALSRDLDRATNNYREIMNKVTSAELAEELERTQRGERFVLVRAANYPSTPSKPNRPGIILLGLTLALGAGVGSTALAEYLDRRIHGPKELAAVFNAPPLAIIPEIPG